MSANKVPAISAADLPGYALSKTGVSGPSCRVPEVWYTHEAVGGIFRTVRQQTQHTGNSKTRLSDLSCKNAYDKFCRQCTESSGALSAKLAVWQARKARQLSSSGLHRHQAAVLPFQVVELLRTSSLGPLVSLPPALSRLQTCEPTLNDL